jgi:type IV secretory pathway VirB2 component (pilin)
MQTSSMRHSLMLSCLTCLFAFFLAQGPALASGDRLQPCNTSGNACNSEGLACDKSIDSTGVCVFSYETPCKSNGDCGVGRACKIGGNANTQQGGSSSTSQSGGTPSNNAFGVCETVSGSVNSNPLSDTLCNAYSFVTGKIGRTLVVIVIFVTGVTFYLGKVSWGSVTAILLGAGLCFGGPAIVAIIVGGKSC